MTTALCGLDALVFTGGAGEGSSLLRATACGRLEHLGVTLDVARNEANAHRIGADGAPVAVLVVAASEEIVIARQTAQVLTRRNLASAKPMLAP